MGASHLHDDPRPGSPVDHQPTTWGGIIKKWPKQTFLIVGNELCERFSFYGMRAVLTLYFFNILNFSQSFSTVLFHAFTVICYSSPLLGSILADGYIGKFWTIFFISIFYACGQILLAFSSIAPSGSSHHPLLDLLGLLIVGLGTGGIKPCVSAFGGDQFPAHYTRMISLFFSMFYFSINAGSLISMWLTPYFRSMSCFGHDSCYPLAFGIPAILMIVATLVFMAGSFWYKKVPPKENIIFKVIGTITTALRKKASSSSTHQRSHWLEYSLDGHDCALSTECKNLHGNCAQRRYIEDIKRLFRVIVMMIPVPMFWALYDQQGSTWVLQAVGMDAKVFGFEILPDQMGVLNAFLILFFIPIFQSIVYPTIEKLGFQMTMLRKMAGGGILTAVSFFVCGIVQLFVNPTLPYIPMANEAHLTIINTIPSCDFNVLIDSREPFDLLRKSGIAPDDSVRKPISFTGDDFFQPNITFDNLAPNCPKFTAEPMLAPATSYVLTLSPNGWAYNAVRPEKPKSGKGELSMGLNLIVPCDKIPSNVTWEQCNGTEGYSGAIALCKVESDVITDNNNVCDPTAKGKFYVLSNANPLDVHDFSKKSTVTAFGRTYSPIEMKPGTYRLFYTDDSRTHFTPLNLPPVQQDHMGGQYLITVSTRSKNDSEVLATTESLVSYNRVSILWWSSNSRELKNVGDEIKIDATPEDAQAVDTKLAELQAGIDGLLATLQEQNVHLEEKREQANRVQSESQKAAGKINSLVAEIADLDPIGRSRDELQKQKKEVVELAGDLGSAQTKMLELGAEWEAALGAGIVAQPVFEMNRAATDELNKLAARAGKRLAQREKKITETEDEIDKLHADADQIVGALEAIAKDEALQGAPSQLLDPKQVSEKVRQLKESLKPVGEKMDAFNTDCKLLIKTAGPESDTKELDSLLKKVGDAYSDVVGKVSDKEMSVDAAVQQQGKVEDAYRALLNWLEETEEMMENRKKPSADAKVAKAQLHDYEVLMKHVEDKKPSVDGFKAMIEKIVAEASSDEEKKALGNKNAQIEDRYKDLLNSAVDRQRKLLDAVDLAERLQEVTIPLDSWLQSADKRLQALAKVPITVEKAEEMIGEQEALQDELEHKSDDLKDVLEIAPMLASLVSVEDANSISGQVNQLEARARALDAGITNMRPLLESFLQQIQDFTLDAEDMTQFVGETEVKLGELDELPIEPDDLVEQTNILAEIAVSIADRDEMMANIFEVGKQLAIQGEPEEALIAQKKLDDLKFRYADLMTSADEKIALLAKAIPLSEGFHEGFDTVMQVLEDMDRDLQTIDEEDPETQAELIFLLEEDISQKMRPSVDELTALSNQLQVLCSADKADELQTNTIAMNKLVNSVADRVARRAERIEMASKQSRAVLDDLQYLIEWFSAARERILEGAPPSLDLEVLKSQLKHQRITNEEASANKVQFRNVAGEAKKVARQLGMEGNEANEKISDTVDEGKELVEEVMALCADRTETLERALALMEQLTSQFDELNKWLDQMDAELQASPSVTTATPAAELREMHDHNEELARMVAAYRPIIEGFKSDVGSLHEVLAEDQAPLLESVAGELVQGYEEVREAVRARGHAIDNMMGATIGFGERLETLVANLQGAADRLRENEGISADPSVLESRLAENRSIVESLRDKQNAYDALKQTASELLASAPEGDAAAGDVENKLNRLEKLWKEIEREAVDRGVLLEDVLDKAKHFWSELDSCQKAVDDLRNRLELVEPATGHPEQLADQQEIMAQVASEMERARPRIEALSIAGKQLADYVPDDEKAVIENQVANVRGGFSTITGLFAEKKRDLIAAMEEAMTFHGDLQELLKWLDMAEQKLLKMSPVEHAKHMTEIEQLLKELHTFKDEVHERGVAKEQVVATALQLAADAPPHLAATVRQPVADLNTRWSRLNAALAEREHKLENLMLQMGKLASTIAQLTAWMDKTRATLKDIAPPKNAVNLRDIEIAQCKLVVLSNDIHAHQDSVNAVNRAAQKYIQTSGALDAETSDSLKSMNLKWEDIQKVLESLAFDMEVAKKEAENVGGEVEKWQRWLEETESALLSTKPTGGLPETAEFQLDEFKALKLDVEHNASPLEAHLHATEQHLKEEPQDADTWLSKTHGAMKTKWNKVKELLVDREKKLQVAYEQAVALESALNDMEDWIIAAERKLTDQPSISRLPDVIEKQLAEHESWMEEVAGRKMAMTKHQASGVHMQYYCEKKDAIPIKNRLVSLKHRVEKISGRTAERAKQLAVTRDEVATWQDGLHDLEHFISDVLVKIAPEPNTTSSLEKLKAKLEEVKEAQRDVTAKQTLFDVTRKRGIGLAERATRSEYKQISMTNEKMSKKWAEMLKKLRDRLREAEQAVLEGGAFEESMNDLESWVDDELERYQKAEHEPVFADIDGVRALVDEESRRSAERKTKENGVKTVVKKADALMASGVDEKDSIAQAKERLVEKWNQVEEAARHRGNSIKEAEQAAEEFDAKTHALLDWLAVEEQKLKASGLDEVEGVKQEMDEAKGRYQECLKKGEEILSKCQPAAEPILRNWMRVVEARWKEVSEKVDEREFTLLEQEQKAKEQNEQIEKLAKFAAQKREELNRMIEQPPAQDLDTMEQNICDFANLDSELREQQPEVDAACKSAKKGARNPAAEMLSTEWKKLWLDAMGLQSSLDNQKALLEEMKRLEGWKWEDWKERYVEWNDHAKARVNDLFRRIDRLHTGNVPRQVFIDGIIGSKFPTSRLEMAKVADRFDKGDGMINAKEFINALRFDASNRNAKPQTDTEKITHEIELQKKTCSCCTPYQIEKISENHYRFGDTHIKRMVRILRSTVMVRVGGGWESLDEFLHKHDPCRAKGRLNINMFPEARPIHALDSMRSFTKNRHGKQLPTTGTPGPIMKIREKTDRSVPMSGGLGGTAGYTVTTDSHRHTDARPSRIPRAPSDMSAGRLSRVGSVSNSKNSIVDSSTPSRPESRASSDAGDRQTRIPSLRARKGQRYIPQGPSSSSSK